MGQVSGTVAAVGRVPRKGQPRHTYVSLADGRSGHEVLRRGHREVPLIEYPSYEAEAEF